MNVLKLTNKMSQLKFKKIKIMNLRKQKMKIL